LLSDELVAQGRVGLSRHDYLLSIYGTPYYNIMT